MIPIHVSLLYYLYRRKSPCLKKQLIKNGVNNKSIIFLKLSFNYAPAVSMKICESGSFLARLSVIVEHQISEFKPRRAVKTFPLPVQSLAPLRHSTLSKH